MFELNAEEKNRFIKHLYLNDNGCYRSRIDWFEFSKECTDPLCQRIIKEIEDHYKYVHYSGICPCNIFLNKIIDDFIKETLEKNN